MTMADRPLGPRQLELLRGLANPCALVVPDPVSRSLVKRGLLAADPDGSFAHITPAGLRALADAADDGRVQLFRRTGVIHDACPEVSR